MRCIFLMIAGSDDQWQSQPLDESEAKYYIRRAAEFGFKVPYLIRCWPKKVV